MSSQDFKQGAAAPETTVAALNRDLVAEAARRRGELFADIQDSFPHTFGDGIAVAAGDPRFLDGDAILKAGIQALIKERCTHTVADTVVELAMRGKYASLEELSADADRHAAAEAREAGQPVGGIDPRAATEGPAVAPHHNPNRKEIMTTKPNNCRPPPARPPVQLLLTSIHEEVGAIAMLYEELQAKLDSVSTPNPAADDPPQVPECLRAYDCRVPLVASCVSTLGMLMGLRETMQDDIQRLHI